VVDANSVSAAVVSMMKKTEVFEDSAKKLLGALSGEVD